MTSSVDTSSMYKTCNLNCADPLTNNNSIVCRMTQQYPSTWNDCNGGTAPSGSQVYSCANREGCCRGEYTIRTSSSPLMVSIGTQFVAPNILGIPSTTVSSTITTNINRPWLFSIQPNPGNGWAIVHNLVPIKSIDTQGNLTLLTVTESWDTQKWPTYTINHDTWETDASKCDVTWCPWSPDCVANTESIRDYCSGIDSNGHPRLNTDVNCQAWCDKLNYVGECGTAATMFCTQNSWHPACKCQTFTQTDAYKEVKQLFNEVPGCDVCKVIPDPVCWAEPCTQQDLTDPDRSLLTTQQRVNQNSCKNLKLTFCNQILEFEKVNGSVKIDHNSFTQICGNDGPTPSPSNSTKNTGIIVLLCIVLLVILINL